MMDLRDLKDQQVSLALPAPLDLLARLVTLVRGAPQERLGCLELMDVLAPLAHLSCYLSASATVVERKAQWHLPRRLRPRPSCLRLGSP